MVMALTPCGTREARLVLAAAAELAQVPVADFAAAVVAGAHGEPVPARWDRALRRAVGALLGPRPGLGPEGGRGVRGVGLLPSRARTGEVLARFRASRERLAAAPGDGAARSAMDDDAYTLCVLMGRSTLHEAVMAAELHLAGPD
ncbi:MULTISPECIES: DUF5133 domain-containing protein [Streptomyces]|nr:MULTISPECIES: DUF5133 domain-containing protein [Streptomyces]MBP2348354.1 hypothetical protein [Streptomyces virginiae]MCI4085083.1 DUF5133 domain-containing protein [Streptomyces sp. MMS21 TC-5]